MGQITYTIMFSDVKIKIIIGVILVLLVVAVAFYYFLPEKSIAPTVDQESGAGENPSIDKALEDIVLPPATGDIDKIVEALLSGAAADGASASEEDEGADLLNLDSKEISDFGQSYNAEEF